MEKVSNFTAKLFAIITISTVTQIRITNGNCTLQTAVNDNNKHRKPVQSTVIAVHQCSDQHLHSQR